MTIDDLLSSVDYEIACLQQTRAPLTGTGSGPGKVAALSGNK
jgi:hypothetical protein